MSLDTTSLEADLRSLRPAALDESLLARLEASSSATWTELDPMEVKFEQQLRNTAPAKLPAGLMASLEAATDGVPFSNQKKIVRFPGKEASAPPSHNRSWWAAAAAVALTGAVTALLVPNHQPATTTADTHPKIQSAPLAPGNSRLIPAGFNRGLSQASDEGVILQSGNQPHRVLKVVYTDRVTLKDAQGKTYQVEQPRVEYILVPAKTD